MKELVTWYDDEYQEQQLQLEKETSLAVYSSHPWVDKEFHCCFHPSEINTRVLDVLGNKVYFSYIANEKPVFAACTIREFKRDFTPNKRINAELTTSEVVAGVSPAK